MLFVFATMLCATPARNEMIDKFNPPDAPLPMPQQVLERAMPLGRMLLAGIAGQLTCRPGQAKNESGREPV